MGFRLSNGLIYFFGALGGLLFGYDTGVISGAILFIRDTFHLSPLAQGWVVSSILVGAVVGSALSGPIADRIGRRRVVIGAAFIFCVGAVGSALSTTPAMLIVFRIVLGIAVGTSSTMVPMYLSEMAPTEIRGALSSLNQLMIVTGILFAYIVDYAFSSTGAWRWMLGLAVIPGAILFMGMLFLPESPRWLLKYGEEHLAREVLIRLRRGRDIETELAEIRRTNELEARDWTSVFAHWVRPALGIGIGLAVFQQFIGCNTVIYYAPTTFTDVGLGSSAAILGTVGIGSVQVLMTLVAVRLIDRVGRKPLLAAGSLGMGTSLVLLGIIHMTLRHSVAGGWITLIFLALYIFFFSISWGPVVWVMLSEIFPLGIRGAGMAVGAVFNWISNLLVSLTFPYLLKSIGLSWVFILYGILGVVSLIFVLRVIEETKGRSLEQIEMALREKNVTTTD